MSEALEPEEDRMQSRREWNRRLDAVIREIEAERQGGAEPEAAKHVQLPPLTIKPGSHHAAAAFREGREDEYIDRMRSKYGGEW